MDPASPLTPALSRAIRIVCFAVLTLAVSTIAPAEEKTAKQASAELLSLGATIGTGGTRKSGEVVSVHLEHQKIYDADLVHLRALKNIRNLYLAGTKITSAGLKNIAHLSEMRRLSLWGTRVTDGGLVHLSELTKLEALDIHELKLTGKGLAHLKNLSNLRFLNLRGIGDIDVEGFSHLSKLKNLRRLILESVPGVTDAGLAKLEALEHLRALNVIDSGFSIEALMKLKQKLPKLEIVPDIPTESELPVVNYYRDLKWKKRGYPNPLSDMGTTPKVLNLIDGRIADDQLERLKLLPRLEKLSLDPEKITDAAMVHVAQLKQLRVFRLWTYLGHRTKLTDAGLAHLAELSNLETVDLAFAPEITDEGMVHLGKLPNLKWLGISGSKVTEKGLAHLKTCRKLEYIVAYDTEIDPASIDSKTGVLPGVKVELFD